MVKAARYNNRNRIVLGWEKIRCGDVFVKENESNFVLNLVSSKWERKQGIN